jgi:NADP-dependent 3-hydroxy acid dehydrogenase YdfG
VTNLANKIAVVTGASSGIGAATARELARNGAKIVLAARRIDRLRAEEEAIAATGGEALSVATDITDPEQVAYLIKAAESHFGRVDVLVNNAGAFWREALVDTAPQRLIHLMQVNLLGAMLATREALPGMLERGQGSIITMGSVSGRVAMEPVYSAGKYGLRGFSLALRRQLSGTGVNVSCIEPGNIRTDMTRHVGGALPEPDLVARAVVRLIERPRREIVIPQKHYAIVWLEQAFPALADLAFRVRRWSPVE